MGYFTNFTLTASACTVAENGTYTTASIASIPQSTLASLESEIEKMNVFDEGWGIENEYFTNAKWYDWEEDMCLLSKRFPEFLFCLHGEGEEDGDLWNAYFLGGKCQYCPAIVTYDEFEPSKLCKSSEKEKYSYES